MQILSIKLYFHYFVRLQLLLFIFLDLAYGKDRGHSLLKVPLKSSTHLLLNFWVTTCFREDLQSKQSKC